MGRKNEVVGVVLASVLHRSRWIILSCGSVSFMQRGQYSTPLATDVSAFWIFFQPRSYLSSVEMFQTVTDWAPAPNGKVTLVNTSQRESKTLSFSLCGVIYVHTRAVPIHSGTSRPAPRVCPCLAAVAWPSAGRCFRTDGLTDRLCCVCVCVCETRNKA